jgi:hypothetical protein
MSRKGQWSARFTVFVVCFFAALASPRAQSPSEADAVWEKLQYKTAWIWLGDVQVANGGGLGGWLVTNFEPRREGRAPFATLPVIGDRLRLTRPGHLVILNFRVSGESKRLTPPASPGSPTEVDHDVSGTSLVLPAGSFVRIESASLGPSRIAGAKSVWARVTPATRAGLRR